MCIVISYHISHSFSKSVNTNYVNKKIKKRTGQNPEELQGLVLTRVWESIVRLSVVSSLVSDLNFIVTC